MKSIEMETVTLKMKPVCKCGYVFDELTGSVEFTYHNGYKMKHVVFDPPICPKCRRYIEDIVYKVPNKNGKFDCGYSHVW